MRVPRGLDIMLQTAPPTDDAKFSRRLFWTSSIKPLGKPLCPKIPPSLRKSGNQWLFMFSTRSKESPPGVQERTKPVPRVQCFGVIAEAKVLSLKKHSASEFTQTSVDCSCSVSGPADEVGSPTEVAEEPVLDTDEPVEVFGEGDITKLTGRKKGCSS
ncbi:hypothetical protein MLD38_017769 [Melastoma candidum]|uniref:Uncharacterized protein n=1 Tax=Melastoma candidum TaxID=119954 RepID=A0ACB9QQW1_9MYRT|nr:hypothetical protein MLD38_017769 [Melastoma candidum]